MNKIEKLLAEMCPDGVEFKSVQKLLDEKLLSTITPPKKLPKKKYNTIGRFPIIDQGQDFIVGYTDDINALISTEKYIVFGDHTETIKYIDFTFAQGADGIKIIKVDGILPKYIYYSFNNFYKKTGKYTRHFSFLKKIKIPIPPLEVQEEIVRILDKFTELEAELEARRKQYEHYRDELLTFGDKVEWKKLGELLDYEQPSKYIVRSVEYNENFNIPVLTAGQSFILGYTNEEDGIYKASEENPVIIFDDFTTSFHWVAFNFKVKSSAMKILKPKINNVATFKFIYYAMRCIQYTFKDHMRHWISKYSKIKIPVPPISEQERIVSILDKFDSLVNSISEGLPAEIDARRKQYEYYRDSLLTFKPLGKEDGE
ncbi:restriction endonuclease subunit S [bacterium]|nr:restriction endonuclease subunit S [bacterium]